jgi:hypothetical protein
VTPRPLTDYERRAAARLGRGATQQVVADELGVSVKTVRRLSGREDFAALVEQARSQPSNDGDRTTDRSTDDDEPLQILREAMTARNPRNGLPTSDARKAAVAYANLRAAEAQESGSFASVERVVLTGDEPFDREVAAILDAKPTNATVYIVIAARDAGERAASAHIIGLSEGPWRPSRPDPPASSGDQPTPDQPPSGRGE